MQLGFNLPISGPTSGARSFARLAQEGEAMGYDYLTLTDHVVLPDVSVPGYPYSESGEFMSNTPTERHELLTATAFIAAKTSRIRLVLAVLVVPHRPAVLAAKMLSTIDVLSEGRLVVGIGAGWLKAEFDAVVTTPFAERGAVTDEYLEAFRALWTQQHAKFEGRYAKFSDLIFLPRPVQLPHPPIWVGGESGPSLRRAARFGDAWYPIGSNNKALLDTLPRLASGIGRLRKLTAEAGRDPAAVTVVFRVKRYGDAVAPVASDGERRLFSGSDADIVGDLRALAELGVTAIDVEVEGHDEAATLANMRRFKDTIFARV
jgi:probable F420-dependent oxidoreductase